MFDLLRMHIEVPAPEMRELAPDLALPPLLEICVHRMLEKNPDKRFQTVIEVKDSLKRSQSTPSHSSDQASPVVPRRIRAKLLLAGIVALASIAIVVYIFRSSSSSLIPSTAERLEGPYDKFNRLFEYKKTDFLSYYTVSQVCPRESGNITDADLECLGQVVLSPPYINLAFTNITGSGLAKLNNIRGLELDLSKTEMTEEGFRAIGTLQNLCGLGLNQAKVDISEQTEFPRRTDINRKLTEISKTEIDEIVKATALKELNLNMCKGLDDQCLELLGHLPLRQITLKDAQKITDVGIAALARNKKLLKLDLDGTDITDKAVELLSEPGELTDIRLNRCKGLTGKSIRILCNKNPNLKLLGVSFIKTTAKDLHSLEGKDLTFLELFGVPLGPDELRMIGTMHNMESMYLGKIEDPDSLKYLYPLKKLFRLVLTDTSKLDEKSLSELQNNLKGTTIIDGRNKAGRADVQDFEGLFDHSSSEVNPFDN